MADDKKETTRSGSTRESTEASPTREASRGRSPAPKRRSSRSASRSRSGSKKRYSKSRSPRKRSTSSSPANNGNVLYFAGLHVNTREQDLEDICSKYGTVHTVQIIYDPRSGDSRGFAFVTMGNEKEADAVLSNLNGRELDGKALTIEKARRSQPRKATPGKYLGKLNNRSRFGVRDRFDRRYDYPPPRADPYERYSPPRGAYRRSPPPGRTYREDSPRYRRSPPRGTYRRDRSPTDYYDRRYR
eukprot:TRINITY_DN4896_c0_g1_i1.p1 TRINITY_DN4896_c0_g1~~TRINITY_DN4896_c0_g1_i1.p1  ORF type:complete len:244 (-),score=11.05 TRINITY_DN4896_c0_g1_i1:249-980(-)